MVRSTSQAPRLSALDPPPKHMASSAMPASTRCGCCALGRRLTTLCSGCSRRRARRRAVGKTGPALYRAGRCAAVRAAARGMEIGRPGNEAVMPGCRASMPRGETLHLGGSFYQSLPLPPLRSLVSSSSCCFPIYLGEFPGVLCIYKWNAVIYMRDHGQGLCNSATHRQSCPILKSSSRTYCSAAML